MMQRLKAIFGDASDALSRYKDPAPYSPPHSLVTK